MFSCLEHADLEESSPAIRTDQHGEVRLIMSLQGGEKRFEFRTVQEPGQRIESSLIPEHAHRRQLGPTPAPIPGESHGPQDAGSER